MIEQTDGGSEEEKDDSFVNIERNIEKTMAEDPAAKTDVNVSEEDSTMKLSESRIVDTKNPAVPPKVISSGDISAHTQRFSGLVE